MTTKTLTRHDVSAVPLQGGYVAKQCPVRAQNAILRPCEPEPVSAALERRFARGRAFEAETFERLRAARPDAVCIRDASCPATIEAMSSDAHVIIGGQLPADGDGRRVGRPDILVAAAGGGWRAVDVKHHMTLSPRDAARPGLDARCSAFEAPGLGDASPRPDSDRRKHRDDMLQLAHYQRMLEACGSAASAGRFGGIVGTEGVVVWHDLDEPIWRTPSSNGRTKLRSTMEVYDFEYAFRLDVMAVAQRHLEDASCDLLVVPVSVPECESCPWAVHCSAQLSAGSGDVSLVPRLGWRDWVAHRERGVTDRAALARLDVPTAEILHAGIDPATLVGLTGELADELTPRQVAALAALGISSVAQIPAIDALTASYHGSGVSNLPEQIDQARAAIGPEPVYRRRGVDRVEVPRADVEVDVDMESVEDGCYLWGTYTAEGYRAFVTWEPLGGDAEIENFRRFWTWLQNARRAAEDAGLTFRAYCYNASAENRYLRAQGEAAGVRDKVDAFIASDAWVDLLPVFRDQLITGRGNALKDVAPLTGFEWDVEGAGGDQSMVAYDLAVAGDAASRAWLLSYNRSDVRATLVLRGWLARGARDARSIADCRRSASVRCSP